MGDSDTISGGISYSFNKPIIPSGAIPSGRGGCTTVHVDGKLIVFGGHYYAGDNKFEYLNETWVLDIEKLSWRKVNCLGEIPLPRYGHSAHLLGSRMFIFGGKGPKKALYNDVYFLNLIDWTWVSVSPSSNSPSARFFHASEVVGRKIVIHGGWDCQNLYDDMWIFNTDSFSWLQPKTAGFGPTVRYGHSLTLAKDGRLFLFGGCTLLKDSSVPVYNNDIHVLDTETMIWIRPRVNGNTPTGRYGHTATLMDDGYIVIFGGWGSGGCQSKEWINNPKAHSLQILDTQAMTWWIPNKLGNKPLKHLYNHCCNRSGSSSSMLVFGGFDGRQAVYDFSVINIEISITDV